MKEVSTEQHWQRIEERVSINPKDWPWIRASIERLIGKEREMAVEEFKADLVAGDGNLSEAIQKVRWAAKIEMADLIRKQFPRLAPNSTIGKALAAIEREVPGASKVSAK